MKQLTTSKRVEQKNTVEKKDIREDKGHILAISRRVYRIQKSDILFYVESEISDNVYYFVKFKPDVFLESWYCSCKDNSIREMKCKHIFAIEFAIKWGTIKDIATPLTDVKGDTAIIKTTTTKSMITSNSSSLSYKDDDYTF